MIKKFFHIIKGWGKRSGIIATSTAEQKLSDLRMQICKACPQSGSSKILKILRGNANYENTLTCTICGCPAEEKTIVIDESCPLKKW